MKRKEHPWYLLSGSIFGLILGLLLSWVFFPVVYTDTLPSSLRTDYKDQYRFMIASSFSANHDIVRASARLNTISDEKPLNSINQQIHSMQSNKYPLEQVQVMEELAYALQMIESQTPTSTVTSTITITSTAKPSQTPIPTKTDIPTNTPTITSLPSSTVTQTQIQAVIASPTTIFHPSSTSTITRTPKSTPTPVSTKTVTSAPTSTVTIEISPSMTLKPISTLPLKINRTSTPTPEKIFKLVKKTGLCDQSNPGLLQISLKKSNSAPAAGVEIVISWNSGEDHFFTGLKPELGFGYADFKMSENVEYTLSLSRGNTRVTNLKASTCSGTQNGKYLSGLLLEFMQP